MTQLLRRVQPAAQDRTGPPDSSAARSPSANSIGSEPVLRVLLAPAPVSLGDGGHSGPSLTGHQCLLLGGGGYFACLLSLRLLVIN